MSEADWSFLIAFVAAPVAVMVLGYVAVRIFETSDDRHRRDHPAE